MALPAMQTNDRSLRFPVLTATACAVCSVIFLAVNMQTSTSYDAVRRWGLYSDQDIYNGAYWALITTAFVHVQPIHLIFNLYWLWYLGGAFERHFGPLKWLIFVLSAAWVSSGIQLYSGTGGIGMYGVGYALFGFGWMARPRIPEFARIVNDKTVMTFLGWGILCIVTTYLGIMNIANLAHLGGLVFGVVLGYAYSAREYRLWTAPVMAILAIASSLPLYHNPMSVDWLAVKASDSYKKKKWNEAESFYKQALARGGEPEWVWHNLAQIYEITGSEQEFLHALDELRRVDPESASELAKDHGLPESSTSKPSP